MDNEGAVEYMAEVMMQKLMRGWRLFGHNANGQSLCWFDQANALGMDKCKR